MQTRNRLFDDAARLAGGAVGTLAGIRRGGRGDVTATHRLWTCHDIGSFVPTPAIHGGKIYVVRDRGEVVCVDPKSGEVSWSDALPRHRASYYSSPVVAGGRLYAAREDGRVFVARIAGGFQLVSENDMGEKIIASPVPVIFLFSKFG